MGQNTQHAPAIKRRQTGRIFAFGIVVLACVICSGLKSGFFVDEIYSYGLANSNFNPFMQKDGGLIDRVISKKFFSDYVVVTPDERFDFASVNYNQTQDNHPPLHYGLLHFVCSLCPGTFTKWTGLGLNFVLFALTVFLLYRLSLELTQSEKIASAAVVLYGISQIALSTFLMIRMYMLLTLLTLVLTYHAASIVKRPKWHGFLGFSLTLFAGLMTQYIFFVYAFFLCAACGIRLLIQKEYKSIVFLALCSMAGVAAFYLAFPACVDHLFADKLVSGATAKTNVLTISNYAFRLHSYGRDVAHGIPIAALLGLLLSGTLLWNRKTTYKALRTYPWQDALVVVLPSLATLLVVALTSPVCAPRYVYNLIPLFVLLVACLMAVVEATVNMGSWGNPRVMLPALAALTIAMTFAKRPDYLFLDRKVIASALDGYTGAPCIFVDVSNIKIKGKPVIRLLDNIPQFMRFEDVFCTNNPESGQLAEYLHNKGTPLETILFVENSHGDADGFERVASAVQDKSGYSNRRFLGKFGASNIYLLFNGRSANPRNM